MASPTSLSLPEPAAAPEGLCSQCAAFDLDDALCFKPAIAVRIVLEIYQLKPKTCAFCRFLSGSMGHLPKGGMYNVTAVQAHFAVTPLLEKIEAPILCIEARRDWRIFNLFNIRSSIIFDCTGPIARNLQPIARLIDYRVVREWIDSCVHTHQCRTVDRGKNLRYSYSVPGLKVIDCEHRLIRDLPATASYVTLSYVWGNPKDQSVGQARLESPAPELLPQDLPATIEDAIKVTLALGHDYLWVDRYCLNKSSEDFHAQLRQMDKIYAGSALTIIAAAGSDGSYGLPGVSRQRVVNQSFYFGRRILYSTPLFSRETLESTTWSSRGWTYQEGLLSTRRLVFTDTQLYYECQERSRMEGWLAPEHMFWRRDEESAGSWCDYFNKNPDPGLFPTINGHVKSVLHRIEAFTKRSLTYEDDVLNALLGIFALLRQGTNIPYSGIQHLWGMPYFGYDVNFRRDRTPLTISLSRFVNNLSWDVDNPVRRRVGFPSWSWTGWIGTVRWAKGLMMVDNGRYHRHRSTPDVPCTVSLELRNGNTVDWRIYHAMSYLHDTSEDARNAQQLTRFIHISAYITQIMQSDAPHCYQLELDRKKSNNDSRPVYVSINPTGGDHVNVGRGLFVMHLPWYLEYGHDSECNVLVVQRQGSHWERVGIGSTSTFLEVAPVEKTWTKIRLG